MSNQPAARLSRHLALATLCGLAIPAAATAGVAAPGPSACSLADAPREDFVMRVPFEAIDGRIYVQAKVDGQGPFRFAVDTGASGLGRADSSLVSALGLETGRPTLNSDGVQTAEIDTTTLDSLDVGGLVRNDVVVPTRDYSSRVAPEAAFSGIVAREFFSDGLLVIDFPGRTIAFSRKLSLSPGQDGALPYERPFRIPVSIGNVRTEGNLDTGANIAFVLPKPLFDRIGGTPLRQAGHGSLANTTIDTGRSTVAGPFRIGNATLRDVEVRVSGQYPEVLIGAHALQDFVVLIDQRSRRVAVCPQ
jgi:predicted aspartyl protease